MNQTRMLPGLLLVLSLALTGVAQEAPAPADPFVLTLPEGFAAFSKQVQTSDTPDGKIETTNWVSKAPSGEAVVVTMSRMPGRILDAEKLINSTRDSLRKSLGATTEADVNLFRSANALFRSQYVVEEDRMFQLLYVGRSEEQRAAAPVAALFDSFKLAR